jgi:hypothetical protein
MGAPTMLRFSRMELSGVSAILYELLGADSKDFVRKLVSP